MKKLTLLVLFMISTMTFYGQAKEQISFGIVGAAWEFPVHKDITIAPAAYTNLDLDYLTLGVKGNYYFDGLFGLPSQWDVYGGANLGYALATNNDNDNDLNLGLQVGGRWFWDEQWGLYVELAGGTLGAGGGIGVTLIL